MIVLVPGHVYLLKRLDSPGYEVLQFVRRSSAAIDYGDKVFKGTNTQEVLRALIERTEYLDGVIECTETKDAAWHLRQALYLYEVRAYRRKTAKLNKQEGEHDDSEAPNVYRDGYDGVPFNEQEIERWATGADGHLLLPLQLELNI